MECIIKYYNYGSMYIYFGICNNKVYIHILSLWRLTCCPCFLPGHLCSLCHGPTMAPTVPTFSIPSVVNPLSLSPFSFLAPPTFTIWRWGGWWWWWRWRSTSLLFLNFILYSTQFHPLLKASCEDIL